MVLDVIKYQNIKVSALCIFFFAFKTSFSRVVGIPNKQKLTNVQNLVFLLKFLPNILKEKLVQEIGTSGLQSIRKENFFKEDQTDCLYRRFNVELSNMETVLQRATFLKLQFHDKNHISVIVKFPLFSD